MRHIAWLKLAVKALRGQRTYEWVCDCPECNDEIKVPWRYRLNQPPFRYRGGEKGYWGGNVDAENERLEKPSR